MSEKTDTKPDQADVLLQVEQLNTQVAASAEKVTTLTGELATTKALLEKSRSIAATQLEELTTLRAEVASLKTENETLAAKAKDVEKQIAERIAKHGISDKAAAAGNPAAPNKAEGEKQLSWTDKCKVDLGLPLN